MKNKTRKGGATGSAFRKKIATIKQMSRQKLLPPEIADLIAEGYSIHIIKKYMKKILLRRNFEAYSDETQDEYDPTNPELKDLTKIASKILDKTDFNNFWRDILAKIYIGLQKYQDSRGVDAKYYNKTEKYFLKLIKILMNLNIDESTYLDNDLLFEKLIDLYLGYND